MEARRELALVRQQNIDVTNFEDQLADFKDKFGRNYRLASERFAKAIDEIDKSIDHLQKIKEHLLRCVYETVSGSGKSSLITDTLAPALANRLNHAHRRTGQMCIRDRSILSLRWSAARRRTSSPLPPARTRSRCV